LRKALAISLSVAPERKRVHLPEVVRRAPSIAANSADEMKKQASGWVRSLSGMNLLPQTREAARLPSALTLQLVFM